METIGRDASNLASFGWDWTEPDGGTRFQLVNIRGTYGLALGRQFNGQWDTIPVTRPDRFLTAPPKTRKEWLAVVDRWFGAVEETDT